MKKAGACSLMVVVGVVAALIAGCESSSSPSYSGVTISPEDVTVFVGTGTTNPITFVATGGDGVYTWAVNVARLGSLVSTGQTAVYTPTRLVGVNIITVRSLGEPAEATVTQR